MNYEVMRPCCKEEATGKYSNTVILHKLVLTKKKTILNKMNTIFLTQAKENCILHNASKKT